MKVFPVYRQPEEPKPVLRLACQARATGAGDPALERRCVFGDLQRAGRKCSNQHLVKQKENRSATRDLPESAHKSQAGNRIDRFG